LALLAFTFGQHTPTLEWHRPVRKEEEEQEEEEEEFFNQTLSPCRINTKCKHQTPDNRSLAGGY